MKKKILIVFACCVSLIIFSNFNELYEKFWNINAQRNSEEMYQLIQELLIYENTTDSNLISLLAEAKIEYANWAIENEKERERLYDRGVDLAKKAVALDDNSRNNYIAGMGIGRLAQFKGILNSLFLLRDFDRHIDKAMELDPDNYLAFLAKGLRYRDTPAVRRARANRLAEEHFLKAIEINPNYGYIYLELGIMYYDDKEYNKAKEMFEKVLELEPYERFYVGELQTIEDAKEYLEKIN